MVAGQEGVYGIYQRNRALNEKGLYRATKLIEEGWKCVNDPDYVPKEASYRERRGQRGTDFSNLMDTMYAAGM